MHIANALLDTLIFSGLILTVAVILGIKAEKKPVVSRMPARARRRSAEMTSQPRVRVAAVGGGR